MERTTESYQFQSLVETKYISDKEIEYEEFFKIWAKETDREIMLEQMWDAYIDMNDIHGFVP